MTTSASAAASIDEYIAASRAAVQPILEKIRRTIRAAAPGAEELISYRMPAFRWHGILVCFAAFKHHIGLYPPVSGDARLEKSLAPFAGPKGNLKFPLDRPIPYALIRRVVLLRVRQNLARVPARKAKRRGAELGDWRGETLSVVRKLIQEADPDVMEEVKWRKPSNAMLGIPVWSHDGIICTGETYKDKVKVTFAKGALLSDRGKLFNASLDGNTRRAIDIRAEEMVDAGAFRALIRAAVGLNTASGKEKPTSWRASRPRIIMRTTMHPDTRKYNVAQAPDEQKICDLLAREINRGLPEAENRIWHAHPVWFLEGNPVVGYSKLKDCIRLLFWSGQSFEEEGLNKEGSFKAAEVRYTAAAQVNRRDLQRWLTSARDIQWDYKSIVRRKGRLERLK